MNLHREYPHLKFEKQWHITERGWRAIGQCYTLIQVINNTPILPDYYTNLMRVALKKGAQSTTAIEGNTLSDEQISDVMNDIKLPESIEYQAREVRNILDAFNIVLNEIVYENKEQLITKDLLLRFHQLVGKDLGDHFKAIPGHFRNCDVVVGPYRAPDNRDVPALIDNYCNFLRTEFRYEEGKQLFSDVFIEAIVAHVYLEWIHPFGDGNGRVGRLIEFYILSRGANPDITLHILSNHYNSTRSEYYRQLDVAYKEKDLSKFIEYSLIGFRDGLYQTIGVIQESQLKITWQKYVYDKFDSVDMGQKEVFKRKRKFALELPFEQKFKINEIQNLNMELAKLYSNIPERTLLRDVDELITLQILNKEGDLLFANVSAIRQMLAKRKSLPSIIL